MKSVWTATQSPHHTYAPLTDHLEVDTVIIGGGITGLATALKLTEAGQRVALLEALHIGASNTGNSTGNLYATVSGGLAKLREKWSEAVVREVVELRTMALNDIEATLKKHHIDCHFSRSPLYFCATTQDKQKAIEAEHEASLAAGLSSVQLTEISGFPVPLSLAIKIENQAQFNPWLYCQGLAAAATRLGCQLFEGSRVVEVNPREGKVVTVAGDVKAQTIVMATHTPLGINLLQAEMVAYREYGVAAALQGQSPPPAIYWLLDEFHSVRRYQQGDNDYLIVVDEKHETGHGEKGEGYYAGLKQYAREKFGAESFAFQWSAQQYQSADRLPYIGKSGHGNVYVATGFAADGLVWGQAAAELICDGILGHESPVSELLNPRRFTPLKSLPTWTKVNATAARHLVIARLIKDKFDPDNLLPGEGRVFDFEGHKRAVYRAPDNSLIALSPTCPHLKCIVHWNAADSTWDCPCHGSRFSPYGSVIEGPALVPLEQIELPGAQEK